MTFEELKAKGSYELKLQPAGQSMGDDGKTIYRCQANIQIFDMDKKITVKAVSGSLSEGESIQEAEDKAIERACELLGSV